MDGLVLRPDLVTHDPDKPAAATAHAKLLQALNKLDVEIQPPAQKVDLVGRCRQAGLEPSKLLFCSTTKDILPFLWRIFPRKLMTPQVRRCLCDGASIPDVDVPFESRLPGVPVDTNAIPDVEQPGTKH